MDILKLRKYVKKRMQVFDVFYEEGGDYVSLVLSVVRFGENWEEVLQKRLVEEVKNKEFRYLFDDLSKEIDVMNVVFEMGYNGVELNWNIDDKNKKYKKRFYVFDFNVNIISSVNYQFNALINVSFFLEFVEFIKDYIGFFNVDRDVVLFY